MFTTDGTTIRRADGTYEHVSDASVGGLSVFRGTDGRIYGWQDFGAKRRLFQWTEPDLWTYVLGTQRSVYTIAADGGDILMVARTQLHSSWRVYRYDGTNFVPAAPPGQSQRSYHFELLSGVEHVYLIASPWDGSRELAFVWADGWVTLPGSPCDPGDVRGGMLANQCGVLRDNGWDAFPSGGLGQPYAFPSGRVLRQNATDLVELVADAWRAVDHPEAISGTVTAASAAVVEIASDDGVLELDAGTWSRLRAPIVRSPEGAFRVGDARYVAERRSVVQWDGTRWNDLYGGGGRQLVARADGTIYGIDDHCELRRWDGAAWTKERAGICGSPVIAFAGDQVVYAHAGGVDQWAGPGTPWIRVDSTAGAVVGQLREESGVERVAKLSAGELTILDASGAWSPPIAVDGLSGTAISGRDANLIVTVDGDRLLRWDGTAVEVVDASMPLGTTLWSDGTTAWTGAPVVRCELP